MSSIVVKGCGAVSPAGWDVASLRQALRKEKEIPTQSLSRSGRERAMNLRPVPAPQPRPSFLAHARLRRASPITHYATAAALEALGNDLVPAQTGQLRLGIILTVLSGCVNYSRRFYDEALKDPATASPLVFPETVFNAPSSHLAAMLGATAINYTMVGDAGTFLAGLALAADWLLSARVDSCLVIGTEESDWLTADAFQLFHRDVVMSEGAGALYLRAEDASEKGIRLRRITDPHPFVRTRTRSQAAEAMRAELGPCCPHYLLCDSANGIPKLDAAERFSWRDWFTDRLSPKEILGESLAASSAWQCVAAIDALRQDRYALANVSVVGCNQQAIGAQFVNEAFQLGKNAA